MQGYFKMKFDKGLMYTGWNDRIVVLKRQIILIYKDEKSLQDDEREDYLMIKEITVSGEKNSAKFGVYKN